MGGRVCKKCGVPQDYYNEATQSLPSCRVHTYGDKNNCICNGNGNCYHQFEYRFAKCFEKEFRPIIICEKSELINEK